MKVCKHLWTEIQKCHRSTENGIKIILIFFHAELVLKTLLTLNFEPSLKVLKHLQKLCYTLEVQCLCKFKTHSSPMLG